MEIKVMEWNINQRRNYSGCNMPEWIANVIGSETADVVALTELYKGNNWESVKKKAFNSEYTVFESFNDSVGQNDIAIAINTKKMDVIYEKTLFPSAKGIPDHLEVKLKSKETKEEFLFVCIRIHASVTDEYKCQELQNILNYATNEQRVVICGDFNNYRRGCPKREWYLPVIEEMCKAKHFVKRTPDGSSIYEENWNNPPYQYPEDHFLLKGIKAEDFVLLPYNRSFVVNDKSVYQWGKDFQKYKGKNSAGENEYAHVPVCYPDHAILEGVLKI